MMLSNVGHNKVDNSAFNKEKGVDKEKKFINELSDMIELSVKSSNLPDDALINSEVKNDKEINDKESINFLPLGNGQIIDLGSLSKLKEVASKLRMANNNSQQDNIGKNFIFNLNIDNKLFEEINLDQIKKQVQLLDKYGSTDTKVDLENHPKIKLIRETTKDLIQQHREFLAPFKAKLGISDEMTADQISEHNFEMQSKIKEVKDSNKSFFNSLREKLNSEDFGSGQNKILEINIDGKKESESKGVFKDNLSNSVNPEIINTINRYSSDKTGLKYDNNVSPLLNNEDQISKFGLENNNTNGGENYTSEEKLFNGKKLVELFLNGKISAESFNKNISELKQVSNEIKANSKEYIIYKDVQAKNIATNTANTIGNLTPNGNAVIKMNLNPTNLGNIFVEVNVINNVATLNFKTESKETLKLIENQINNLVEKLNNQGISADTISVSSNQDDKQDLLSNGKFFDKENKEQKERQEYFENLKNLALLNEIK